MKALRRPIGLALTLASITVAGCAPSIDDDTESAGQYSSSGVEGPSYERITRALANLARSNVDWVELIDYGTSKNRAELYAVKISDPSCAKADGSPAVLITGATHGDEYLGFEDKLPEWFVTHRNKPGVKRFFEACGTLYIIPIVNPDGFEKGTRANANGEDLNRDFFVDTGKSGSRAPREPETIQLTRWLEEELASSRADLRLTLDYHCCQRGSFIYPDNLTPDSQRAHQDVGELLQRNIASTDMVGDSMATVGYEATNTSMSYYHRTYGSLSFSFEGKETGFFGRGGERLSEHGEMWNDILDHLATSVEAP